jgi:signal transduction histidine kinase
MTVRAKLLWAMTAIGLLVATPAIYGITRLAALRDIAAELKGRHAEAFLALGRLQAALSDLDRYQRSYLVVPGPELHEQLEATWAAVRREIDHLTAAGYRDAAAQTEQRLSTLRDATLQIDALIQEGRVEEATQFFERTKPLLQEAVGSLEPVARTVDRWSSSAVASAERISATATFATLIALLVSATAALLLALWATGSLVRPLGRLRAATGAVAKGELVAPADLPYGRGDEIGDLSRSFRAMTQRLAELDRLKAEFVSIASHELKTPINVIGGYAELLEDGIYGKISAEQREVLSAIREQTRNLGALAHQLLDLGRLEAGQFPIELQDTPLRPFFEELERAFRALALQKKIAFAVELDPRLPAAIAADPQRLRHEVLGNLLGNAFKFTPEGGKITVTVRAGDALRIAVADTGAGIPGNKLPHIFEKYYQVRGSAHHGGAGLGLAIAREIVEAHGGQIRAESTVGKGTTMAVELPLRAAPARASA